MIIGFTTGCLYHAGVPFDDRIKLYRDCDTNAIELAFPRVDDILSYDLSIGTLEIINQFEFVSIHAPWLDVEYACNGKNVNEIFSKLKLFSCHINNIKGIVFHFDVIKNWLLLKDFAGTLVTPILVENMDPSKKSGKMPGEFTLLDQYNLNLVLDLFHAYEQTGSDLKLDTLIMEFMAIADIEYIHVSGIKESERHVPLYMTDMIAEQAIIESLKFLDYWPLILEGKIKDNFKNNLLKELNYVKQSLEWD